MPLTTDDIKALRQATSVTFHFTAVGQGDDGTTVTARRDTKDSVFGDSTAERRFDTEKAAFTLHGPQRSSRGGPAKAVCNFNAEHNDLWNTVVADLRVGDKLTPLWVANNDTEILKEAELHNDEFYLKVNRGDKTKTYWLDARITPDGSTAAMIELI